MKTILKLALVSMLGVISQSALADRQEFDGKTTCSILKNNKLVKKAPCSFTGGVYANVGSMGSGYDFTIKGYQNLSTSVELQGDNVERTLNEKPATPLIRDKTTLKVIPDSVYSAMGEKQASNTVLSCMQQNATKLEICIPKKDGFLGGD